MHVQVFFDNLTICRSFYTIFYMIIFRNKLQIAWSISLQIFFFYHIDLIFTAER